MTHTRLGQIKDCLRRDCQLRSSILFPYESRGGSSDFWLPTSDFRLPTSNFRLRLHTSNFRSDFRLDKVRTPDFWFLTVQSQSWKARPSDLPLPTSHFRLPTSDFRLPTSDFWLSTSDCRLLISHFPLPTSDFRLPISHFWFPNFQLLFGSIAARSTTRVINAQSQSSVERTAVPFSPQKRTTKFVLEKATKQPWLPRKEIPTPVKRLEKH